MRENTSVTRNSTHTEDRRQRENSNPDRPPIEPENPDAPDPFDPFETAHLTDGGAIIQDQTELTFESELDAVLPTPDSPETPSVSPQTPSPSEKNTPDQKKGTNTKCAHHKENRSSDSPDSTEAFNPEPFTAGTLLNHIGEFLNGCETDWAYEITTSPGNNDIEHHAVSDGETVFALRNINNQFQVSHEANQPEYRSENTPNSYSDFESAIAAFVEGIDWGTLPPGNRDPQIWEYTGFTATDETFTEYLSGTSNSECGDHYFFNTAANYSIHIESHQDNRDTTPNEQTMSIVTITDNTSNESDDPVYRGRFPGQKHAFDFIFSALANGLSAEISMYDGSQGDTSKIPPVTVLTTEE